MGEGDLIRLARAGDRQAFADLFRRHVGDAVRTAYLVVGDWSAAEDAAQEAFLRAYGALPGYDPGRPFRPWLYRIVVREALRVSRRLGRAVPMAEPPLAASLPPPEVELAEREVRQRLREAVAQLDERHRVPVVLKYFLEFKEQEVAQVLGLPLSTVKSRLFAARQELRRLMGRELEEPPRWMPGNAI